MQITDTLVVTATLGNRVSLSRTIETVKDIGGKRVKHIIVAPISMCNFIKSTHPYVEILPEPQNTKGIYSALNFALLTFAKDYKYMTYINDDDYWNSDFSKLFAELDDNPNADVVYGRVNYVDESGKIIGEQTSSPRFKAFKALLSENIVLFTQQATLFRTQLFLKLNGFNENYMLVADTDFWLRAIEANTNFKYINQICASYTIQAGQLSSNEILQNEEHRRLMSNVKTNTAIAFIEKILFRITNMRIYFKRFIKFKGLRRMNSFFNPKKNNK
ncbi:MAG: glycosyltransferase [Paludibacter sp.]|nr:glycosyltransferase [Paludibacter sp.]